ncbi:hypothetical protein [Haloarchaeobius sp. HME9146]|uniref:hypothetical protein n=1 Tax=Haloarchaeobius sp. HME9146 TaxID=2978732 RepID=UPI0021C165D9|nr:hypothetical protein [Haloarchaeobius sp. HME9146]MCT9097788.1 hypothetical protein [Haloarchaeobius sp. HME9146]
MAHDDLRGRLSDAVFDERTDRSGESLVVVGVGRDATPAREELMAVAGDVARAFLLHVYDTSMTGVGWVYERADGALEAREKIEGSERYGIDVVDYVKREYDIDGPR